MKKIFVIYCWEKLAKLGDNERILVFYNIENYDDYQNMDVESIDKKTFTVKISGTEERKLIRSDDRYNKFSNVANAMLHFSIGIIRRLIENGQRFQDEKEIVLDTEANYIPPDPEESKIKFLNMEVIDFKKKLGFL